MIIKNILSSFLKKKGYEIKKHKPTTENNLLLNVFDTNHSQNVLISYLTQPFISGIHFSHTNSTECHVAAEIFRDLDYNVDVINYDDETEPDFSKYKIIYGQHLPLEKSFYYKNTEKLIKIFYSTGNNHFYYFPQAAKAVNNFKQNTGKFIPESGRINHLVTPLQFLCSDFIIPLGNNFNRQTYKDIPDERCENLNAFYFDTYDIDLNNKNYSNAKKHFVWFGSGGLISKGLAICIDIFSQRKDCILHICGASQGEKKFWDYYDDIVISSPNIINHGFIDMQSEEFKTLMNNSCFAIFPSVSEGGSPALLNVIANGGLIPIASEGCSIDIEKLGFVIDPLNAENISKNIDNVLDISSEDLLTMSQTAKDFVRNHYTLEKYKENLSRIIKRAIGENSD